MLIDTRYIYAGGLSYELTEGDVVCIFSQYGEVLDINLIRDRGTGISKGFAFLRYEDQRSTILAVDNLSGSKVLGRALRVDHVSEYKQPKKAGESAEDWEQDPRASMNVAPVSLLTSEQRSAIAAKGGESAQAQPEKDADYSAGIDPEDPMFEYLVNERREAALSEKRKLESKRSDKKHDRHHRSRRHRSRSPEAQGHRSQRDENERRHSRRRKSRSPGARGKDRSDRSRYRPKSESP